MRHPIAESMYVAAALGDPIVFMCPRQGRSFETARKALSARMAAHGGPFLFLIDGVRGGALVAACAQLDRPAQRLFPQDADAELLAVSPLAVSMEAQDILTVFDDFWGRGLAVIVLVRENIQAARAHLAANLYVETNTGDLCILRLQDPRTLQRLGDVFHDDQIADLLGDQIMGFVFEGANGRLREISQIEDDRA